MRELALVWCVARIETRMTMSINKTTVLYHTCTYIASSGTWVLSRVADIIGYFGALNSIYALSAALITDDITKASHRNAPSIWTLNMT